MVRLALQRLTIQVHYAFSGEAPREVGHAIDASLADSARMFRVIQNVRQLARE